MNPCRGGFVPAKNYCCTRLCVTRVVHRKDEAKHGALKRVHHWYAAECGPCGAGYDEMSRRCEGSHIAAPCGFDCPQTPYFELLPGFPQPHDPAVLQRISVRLSFSRVCLPPSIRRQMTSWPRPCTGAQRSHAAKCYRPLGRYTDVGYYKSIPSQTTVLWVQARRCSLTFFAYFWQFVRSCRQFPD